MADIRICNECGVSYPETKEYFHSRGGDALRRQCKICVLEKKKLYHEQNRLRRSEYGKKRYQENKEKFKDAQKEYYYKNRDKKLEYQREYGKNNNHKRRERTREYSRKLREDPKYRLTQAVRGRISKCMKGHEGSLRHLPYTRDELREHIERQFTKGMTWENYGSFWHVDHIIPVSSFNITGPDCDDFKACWALTNLRPLKAEENLSKGDRVTHLI